MSQPPSFHSEAKRDRSRIAYVLASVLVASLFVAVLAYFSRQPRRYYSQAVIEILPTPATAPAAVFPATEIETLRGPEVLDVAVKILRLTYYYGEYTKPITADEARVKLRRSLEVRSVKNTPSLVTIGVRDIDPNMAASIANTIVVTYRRYRMDQLDQAKARGVKVDDDVQPVRVREKAGPALEPLPWWQR